MISFDNYKKSLEIFSNIDLKSSLVYFSKKKVELGENTYEFFLPCIKQKPCKLFRLIQRIFDLIFGKSRYLNMAEKLDLSIKNAIEVLSKEDVEVLNEISQKALIILKKFKNTCPKKATQINKFDQNIRENINKAFNVYGLSELDKVCLQKELSMPGCLEITHSIDWEKDDLVLFDQSYINSLFLSIADQQNGRLHVDLQNEFINNRDKQKFVYFLSNLIGFSSVRDRYGNQLSQDNVLILRKMILAIMNTLNSRRQEADFQQLYASFVFQICRALENCSNGINTNIENIFIDITFPKDGSLGRRIKLVLQSMRNDIFRREIFNCINKSDNPDYYLQHEAPTVSYYFSKMTKEVGLPSSVSATDERFQGYALKGQESIILSNFYKHYNPKNILNVILEKIRDCNDTSIPTGLFNEWIESNYDINDRYEQLDDNGNYKIESVLQCLQSLEITKNKVYS
jgi:hypothetical protein